MEFLVAKDERSNHRLRQQLLRMSAKQDFPTPAVWAVLPTRAAIRTMAVNSNRLYHGTPDLGGVRPTLGDHRPIYQNGTLPPAEK